MAFCAPLLLCRGGGVIRETAHDPEKACPALDAGWVAVFRKKILRQR
jgi:hypothetical protein